MKFFVFCGSGTGDPPEAWIFYDAGTTYDDWFLSSYDEILEMKTSLKDVGIGGLASAYYWSSSEYSYNIAYGLDFATGLQVLGVKGNTYRVRAVWAF